MPSITTVLLLVAGAASTMAYSSPANRRYRRSPAGSQSSSSSSSFAGAAAGHGLGKGYPGYSDPYPYYPSPGNSFVPFDFERLLKQYLEQMQRLAMQHAEYASYFAGGNNVDNAFGGYAPGSSPSGYAGGFAGSSPGGYAGGFAGSSPGGYAGGFGGSSPGGGGYGGGHGGSFPGGGGYGGGHGGSFPGGYAGGFSPGGGGYEGGHGGSSPGGDAVGAQASISVGSGGGHGQASLIPDLGSRISQDFPAPSGESYGIFSMASSSSSDINGKKTSHKSATVGVNDNGKVSSITVHDP